MRKNAAAGEHGLVNQRVQLLVAAHGKDQVARIDAPHLEVLCDYAHAHINL